MKQIALIAILITASCGNIFAQEKSKAEELIAEGVVQHDKANFDNAIAKYKAALQLEPKNIVALSELSYTYVSTSQFQKAIDVCKQALDSLGETGVVENIYINYGTALDELKKNEDAIIIYTQGCKAFPKSYLLPFNKCISLARIGRNKQAIYFAEKAICIQPAHPGSHNVIASLQASEGNNVPALLATARFLVLENTGNRAARNLKQLRTLLNSNAKKTSSNTITINLDGNKLNDTMLDGSNKENNFVTVEMTLAMNAALGIDDKYAKETAAQKLQRNMENLCTMLSETGKGNRGFYWEYYAPYFAEMHQQKFEKTFAYIALAATGETEILEWLDKNEKAVMKFREWDKNYKWPSNHK